MVEKLLDVNKVWISKGNMGCTFASVFAKNPERCGWKTIKIKDYTDKMEIPKEACILSIQFPDWWGIPYVRAWAISEGFYEEFLGDGLRGLRYDFPFGTAWVQYFGKDSHVVTRQTPIPELCFKVAEPKDYYHKVGFEGILHMAHASIKGLSKLVCNKLWETSHLKTTEKLGHKAGKKEASKVTWKIDI